MSNTTSEGPVAVDVVADVVGMQRIGARAPLPQYVAALWRRRVFIWKESRSRAFGQIKNTALGQVWLILDPFLNAALYYVIFGLLMKLSRNVPNFVGYLVVGVICFALLNFQLLRGTSLIENRKALIKSFSFPCASLVLSLCIQTLIDFVPTYFAMLIFLMIAPPHSFPTWLWLLSPLVVLLAVPFGIGLASISATFTHLFPDFKFVWPLVSKFWTYGSGIFWSIETFKPGSIVRVVMHFNPGWEFLEIMRCLLVYNRMPEPWLWGSFAAWSFGLGLVGFLFFWLNEEKFRLQHDH